MNVNASLNLFSGDWTFTAEGSGTWVDISVGFTSEHPVTDFDRLSFSWTLVVDGEERTRMDYPPEGTTYVSTDQPYLVCDRVFDLAFGDECEITFVVDDADERHELTESFTIPEAPSEDADDDDSA